MTPPDHAVVGNLRVNLDPPQGFWKGREFPLSPYQAKALFLLATQPLATHDELEWGATSWDASSKTVAQIIHKLRRKVQLWGAIENVRAKGWRLIFHEGKDDFMLKETIIANAGAIGDDRIDAMLIVNKPGGPEITGPKHNPLLMLALLNDAQRKILAGLAKAKAQTAEPEPAAAE